MTSDSTDMAPATPAPVARTLIGRAAEVARCEGLLRQARVGHSAVLVVRGEAGIGKTALLETAACRADGFRIVRIRAVESERRLPYAALHLLCTAFPAELERLQSAHAAAIDAAVGLGDGARDALPVGLATLSLLSDAATRQPLLCVIDDAQCLDERSAQVLGFVLRRIQTAPITVLLAERDPSALRDLEDLPSLRLAGLSDAESRALFGSLFRGRVDESVIGRITAETRGNPQALADVVDDVSADFAGGFGVESGRRLGQASRLLDQVECLPTDSRRLLVVAAADPTGDPALLWRAAGALAITSEAGAALESGGLAQLSPRVVFGDPAWRSEIYRKAPMVERRAAHRALAEATDPDGAPDRRVWHEAMAAHGPDERLARELERLAPAACERGGPGAGAAFLERAADLTLDSRCRAERALAAAAAKLDAGAPAAAARLLVAAELGTLRPEGRARLERQRAELAFVARRSSDTSARLLAAAQKLLHVDPGAARETRLQALVAAIFAGRLGLTHGVAAVARAMPESAATPPQVLDRLLEGLLGRFTSGYPAAYRQLRDVVDTFGRAGDRNAADRWSWLMARIAADLWDDGTWDTLAGAALELAEQTSAYPVLPYALTDRALVDLHTGDFARASALVEQADAVSTAMGNPPPACASLVLAGWRGREAPALALLESARRDARERGEGLTLTTAGYAEAVLYNGLGRYDLALASARDATRLDELTVFGWNLAELVEAAVRSGDPAAATCALEILSERARVSGSDWALGVEARSRALLSHGPRAEDLYREATERLGRTRITVHLARAQLLYGEWLRRRRRRLDARTHLRAARDSFVAMGAEAFAHRAHREYLATGEKIRKRNLEVPGQLTPQEARIAFLARDGLTNPQIGEQMFISARTVEYHLHKVFEKFRITSRRELHLVLDRTVSLTSASSPERRTRLAAHCEVA